MAKISWLKAVPVIALGGTEEFLRDRELRRGVLACQKLGREVIRADTDGEVVDALTMARTFGGEFLIIVPVDVVKIETVQRYNEDPLSGTSLLIWVDGGFNEKKFPVLAEVHGAYQYDHERPEAKKDQRAQAIRFCQVEAANLLQRKDALSEKLAEALVNAVGIDLGMLSFEISKMAAAARFQGVNEITAEVVRSLVRGSTEVDIGPLREALKMRDGVRVASAMERIRRTDGSDPVMLLLRGRGGPADLALKWLRTALLLEKGATPQEIGMRTNTPEWAVTKDLIPSAKRWGVASLRQLVKDLARVDRGVLLGAPAPWASCEAALLIGCLG